MNKNLKHFALNSAHRLGVLRQIQHLDISPDNYVYVLVYHRVDWQDSCPRLDPYNLSATPDQFDQQMRLISNEYHPVSAEDLLNAVLHEKKLPPHAVLVTVDDGYCDFKRNIWPIASQYGILPVLFVPTAYVGAGVFWWDRLYDALQRTTLKHVMTPMGVFRLNNLSDRSYAFRQIVKYMKESPFDPAFAMLNELCKELVPDPYSDDQVTLDWDDLRELARNGVTVAPHTHTHPSLGNISFEQAQFEILESHRLVLAEIGSPSHLFAYPYGSRSAIRIYVGEILRKLDCHLAFTMVPGRARLDHDNRMYLPRIESNPQITIAQFHAKLSPLYDLLARRKRPAL